MLIIGIDPGSIRTGFGIIKKERSRSIHVNSGVIQTPAAAGQSKKLHDIYSRLDVVVREHRPDVMVVESLFHAANTQSLIKLSQARGVVLLLGENYGMEIHEYTPLEIKKGVTGFGRADKDQMVYMVRKILDLPDLKSPDQADALAIALYHSHIAGPLGAR
jgi:crossover junction endodeoxyribonuclease RuvC